MGDSFDKLMEKLQKFKADKSTEMIESDPKPGVIDPNLPTYNRLRILANGILSGQVKLNLITPQHIEVITSFEAYLSAKDCLTEKQLKWCKSLLYQYREIISELIKHPSHVVAPVQRTQNIPVEDHRKYERTVDMDEPKKPSRRGRIIKEEE